MNIFVLDTNPKICASMHCDQHLGKMILEGAQLLSNVLNLWDCYYENPKNPLTYKTTHLNHPITKWLAPVPQGFNIQRIAYLISLCEELDDFRQSLGKHSHASMQVVRYAKSWFGISKEFPEFPYENDFIFCGPLEISILPNLTVVEKYRKYYQVKSQDPEFNRGNGMTYKGRPAPDFMAEFERI